MTRPRICLPQDIQAGCRYALTDDDARYLRSVLRLVEGASLLVFNGSGREGEAVIDHVDDKKVNVKIVDAWPVAPDSLSIILAQSLPKAGKMETILQKATELGVQKIVPFFSQRSVPKLNREKAADRQARWQKIVLEATRQCRQAYIPEVTPVLSFPEMLKAVPRDAVRIILWEEEGGVGIKSFLRLERAMPMTGCCIVVGPEGGFTEEEIKEAGDCGFAVASLGRHVLRVETASLAAIALIQYEWGRFFDPVTGGTA